MFGMILDNLKKFRRDLQIGVVRREAAMLPAKGYQFHPHREYPDVFGVFRVRTKPDGTTATEFVCQVQMFRMEEKGFAFDHYECNCSSRFPCGLRCEHGEALLMIYANFAMIVRSMERIPRVDFAKQMISPRQSEVTGAMQAASPEDFQWVDIPPASLSIWRKP